MKLIIGLSGWIFIMFIMSYVSIKKIQHQIKVYLLILYNALFLCGVFWIFPLLRDK
jgi:hypothetical protein